MPNNLDEPMAVRIKSKIHDSDIKFNFGCNELLLYSCDQTSRTFMS